MTGAPPLSAALQQLARWRVPLGFFVGAAAVLLAAPTPTSLVIGLSIACVGQTLRIWAAGHLEKGRELTRSGPYRWMRHPLYVGSTLLAAGATLASGSLWVALIAAMYLIFTVGAAIASEEAFLRERFGVAHAQWRAGTHTERGRSFSWRRAMVQNREYRSVIGLAAIAALFAVRAGLLR